MYNVKFANEQFIKTAAYLARDMDYDPQAKPGQTQIENWREATMKIIHQHKAAHKEIELLQDQNKKLNALLENMQADVRNYLIPDKTECNQAWLVSRFIWWLDGPDQREAQKTA
ncbi:MAG TPA: hypothetical protein ENJ28_10440 [Gammaproteobacteria bacterium]|nr:hypothetical protein [Gammaproteobacteria bacterium]